VSEECGLDGKRGGAVHILLETVFRDAVEDQDLELGKGACGGVDEEITRRGGGEGGGKVV
jgi:hypothetical protein